MLATLSNKGAQWHSQASNVGQLVSGLRIFSLNMSLVLPHFPFPALPFLSFLPFPSQSGPGIQLRSVGSDISPGRRSILAYSEPRIMSGCNRFGFYHTKMSTGEYTKFPAGFLAEPWLQKNKRQIFTKIYFDPSKRVCMVAMILVLSSFRQTRTDV